jgi:hypothetical protein
MADSQDHPQDPKGDDIERVLIAGLRSEPLNDAAMRRLRDCVLQKWKLAVRQRASRSRSRSMPARS